jgi:hypothetical protein
MWTDKATELMKLKGNLHNFANTTIRIIHIAVPDMNIVNTAIFWDVTTCMLVYMC